MQFTQQCSDEKVDPKQVFDLYKVKHLGSRTQIYAVLQNCVFFLPTCNV